MGWKESLTQMAKSAVSKVSGKAIVQNSDDVAYSKWIADSRLRSAPIDNSAYYEIPAYTRMKQEQSLLDDYLSKVPNDPSRGMKAASNVDDVSDLTKMQKQSFQDYANGIISESDVPAYFRKPNTPYIDKIKNNGTSLKQTALDYVNKGRGYVNNTTKKTGEFIKNHPAGIIGTGIGAGIIGTTGYMLNSLNNIENQYNTSVGPRSDVTEYDNGMVAVGNKLIDSTGKHVGYIDPKTKQGIIAGKPTGAGGITQTLLPTGAGDMVLGTVLDSVSGDKANEISPTQVVYPKVVADYARDSVNSTLQKSTSYNPQTTTNQTQSTTQAKQPVKDIATVAKAASQRFVKKAWDVKETQKINEMTGLNMSNADRVAVGRQYFGKDYRGTEAQNTELANRLKAFAEKQGVSSNGYLEPKQTEPTPQRSQQWGGSDWVDDYLSRQ